MKLKQPFQQHLNVKVKSLAESILAGLILVNDMDKQSQNNKNEAGATAVEYALMAALITVAIAATVQVLGASLIPIFDNATAGLSGS